MKTINKQTNHISNTFFAKKNSNESNSLFDEYNDDSVFNIDGYPNTIKWAVERLYNIFCDDYSHYFPSIDTARNTHKKQRQTRTYAMLKVLCAIIKMTSIETLRIGDYNKANRWCDASIEKISKRANVSLSNTKKILNILVKSGIIKTDQVVTSLDIKRGFFKVSTKSISKDFIDALGLTSQRLKESIFYKKEKQEINNLNKNLPPEKRSTNTPALRLLLVAEAIISKVKKTNKNKIELEPT